MNPILSFALGALAMYYLDPDQGRRRRAVVRDQLVHLRTRVSKEAAGHAKDLQNRAQGRVAEKLG
jgi:hypothetical protein